MQSHLSWVIKTSQDASSKGSKMETAGQTDAQPTVSTEPATPVRLSDRAAAMVKETIEREGLAGHGRRARRQRLLRTPAKEAFVKIFQISAVALALAAFAARAQSTTGTTSPDTSASQGTSAAGDEEKQQSSAKQSNPDDAIPNDSDSLSHRDQATSEPAQPADQDTSSAPAER